MDSNMDSDAEYDGYLAEQDAIRYSSELAAADVIIDGLEQENYDLKVKVDDLSRRLAIYETP